jgi:hypothetical protein
MRFWVFRKSRDSAGTYSDADGRGKGRIHRDHPWRARACESDRPAFCTQAHSWRGFSFMSHPDRGDAAATLRRTPHSNICHIDNFATTVDPSGMSGMYTPRRRSDGAASVGTPIGGRVNGGSERSVTSWECWGTCDWAGLPSKPVTNDVASFPFRRTGYLCRRKRCER